MTRHVIVIGAARSGTKILRDVLSDATGVGRVPYDVGFVWRYGNDHVSHDVLDPDSATTQVRRFIRSYIERYAPRGADPEHDVVIEKTVGNTLRVPFVRTVLPDATFVHLLRDGVDAVESARRQWSTPAERAYVLRKLRHFPLRLIPSYGRRYARTQLAMLRGSRPHAATWGPRYPGIDADVAAEDLLTVCARQWRASVECALSDLRRLDVPVIEVRYEALAAEPRATLDRLVSELQLEASEDDRARAAARLQRGRTGTGTRALDPGELTRLQAEIGPTLSSLGYPAAGARSLPARDPAVDGAPAVDGGPPAVDGGARVVDGVAVTE